MSHLDCTVLHEDSRQCPLHLFLPQRTGPLRLEYIKRANFHTTRWVKPCYFKAYLPESFFKYSGFACNHRPPDATNLSLLGINQRDLPCFNEDGLRISSLIKHPSWDSLLPDRFRGWKSKESSYRHAPTPYILAAENKLIQGRIQEKIKQSSDYHS